MMRPMLSKSYRDFPDSKKTAAIAAVLYEMKASLSALLCDGGSILSQPIQDPTKLKMKAQAPFSFSFSTS